MFIYGGFRFCYTITYLKSTKFNPVTYLTATKLFLVYPVNCCSNYTNIVSNTIHAGIPCIFWFIYQNKNFLINVVWKVVCFVALCPKSTAMVIAGRSVQLTTLLDRLEQAVNQ